jgi:K+-transporting ATPase ATPase C chain
MLTSTLSDFARQSLASLRILIVFTLLLGVGYPLVVWLAGQAFGDRAHGQPLTLNGQVVGSTLLGQDFTGTQWFHSRPSVNDYDTLASAASNLGPTSGTLIKEIEARRARIARLESVPAADVPPDALTASASGLDPQISPAYAAIQAARVARVNGLPLQTVETLIEQSTQGRFLGFHGEPGVNVLELNVAIAKASQ